MSRPAPRRQNGRGAVRGGRRAGPDLRRMPAPRAGVRTGQGGPPADGSLAVDRTGPGRGAWLCCGRRTDGPRRLHGMRRPSPGVQLERSRRQSVVGPSSRFVRCPRERARIEDVTPVARRDGKKGLTQQLGQEDPGLRAGKRARPAPTKKRLTCASTSVSGSRATPRASRTSRPTASAARPSERACAATCSRRRTPVAPARGSAATAAAPSDAAPSAGRPAV